MVAHCGPWRFAIESGVPVRYAIAHARAADRRPFCAALDDNTPFDVEGAALGLVLPPHEAMVMSPTAKTTIQLLRCLAVTS